MIKTIDFVKCFSYNKLISTNDLTYGGELSNESTKLRTTCSSVGAISGLLCEGSVSNII